MYSENFRKTLFFFFVVVVFGMFVCLQRFTALLHLVYHDCIPMLCPERSVESATQGGAPAHQDVWCEPVITIYTLLLLV